MTATYTQRQIMLRFAYIAYTDELLPGIPSPDAQIKTDIEAALSATATNPILPVAGQWSVVWGPVSYTVPGSYYQDNLMYVVKVQILVVCSDSFDGASFAAAEEYDFHCVESVPSHCCSTSELDPLAKLTQPRSL